MVSHNGSVLAFAMDGQRRIFYTILDLVNPDVTSPRDVDHWLENPRELAFPVEIAKVGFGVADQTEMPVVKRGSTAPAPAGTVVRSDEIDPFLSTTARLTADAPFDVLSDGPYVYVIRQAIGTTAADSAFQVTINGAAIVDSTLLIDRFVLVNGELKSKLEVRFQRSRSRFRPQDRKDSLGATDLEDRPFHEPTQELGFVNHLTGGRFAVLLLPTQVANVLRWQIFAHNSATGLVECYNVERSADGLFNTLGTQFFTCPDHSDVFSPKPGHCTEPSVADETQTCNRDLIPVASAERIAETALAFSGATQTVTVAASTSLKFTDAFTVEAWVKPAGDGTIAAQGTRIVLKVEDGSFHFGTASAALPGDRTEYAHVAGIFVGGVYSLYVNGSVASQQDGPVPDAATNPGWTIGGMSEGEIDEVRIWSYARPATDIRVNIGQRMTGLEPGLAAYWRFDEAQGNVAHDQTPNGNNGSISGARFVLSDAPVCGNPGINRDTFSFDGRTIKSGLTALLYYQQENAIAGYDQQSKPIKRSGRVMLAAVTNSTSGGDQIAVLDLAVTTGGKLAQVPDVISLGQLPGGTTKAMPVLQIDPSGFTIAGGVLPIAAGADTPDLFDSATGKIAMYFRGPAPGNDFLVAYYDTLASRSQCALSTDTGAARVICAARGVESVAGQTPLKVTVTPGADAATGTVVVTRLGITETWNDIPLDPQRFAKTINGLAGEKVFAGNCAPVSGSVETLPMPDGVNQALPANVKLLVGGAETTLLADVEQGATALKVAPVGLSLTEAAPVRFIEYDYAKAASTKLPANLANGSLLVRVDTAGALGSITAQTASGTTASSCQWTASPPGRAFAGPFALTRDQLDRFVPAADLTMEAWIKPDESTKRSRVIFCRNGTTSYTLGLEPIKRTAAGFDGQAGFFNFSATDAKANQSGDLTIEAWILPGATQGSSATILNHIRNPVELPNGNAGTDEAEILLRMVGGNYEVSAHRIRGGQEAINAVTFPVAAEDSTKWVHIAAVSTDNRWTLLKNGTVVASGGKKEFAALPIRNSGWIAAARQHPVSPDPNAGAQLRTDDFYSGAIGEIRIWNRARTELEIRRDLHRVITRDEPGLAGAWDFSVNTSGQRTVQAIGTGSSFFLSSTGVSTVSWLGSFSVFAGVNGKLIESKAPLLTTDWSHIAVAYHQAHAVQLDGTSYLDAGSDTTLDISGDLTLEGSIFLDVDDTSTRPHGILSRGQMDDGSGEDVPYLLAIGRDGTLIFGFEDSNHQPRLFKTGAKVPTKKACKVAATRKRVIQGTDFSYEIRLFLDGKNSALGVPTDPAELSLFTGSTTVAADSLSASYRGTSPGSNSQPVSIGRASLLFIGGESGLKGSISEVRIWNVAREVTEIGTDIKGAEQGLVSWWRFQENAGDVTDDSKGSNRAKFKGAVTWAKSPDPGASPFLMYHDGDPVPITVLAADPGLPSGLEDQFAAGAVSTSDTVKQGQQQFTGQLDEVRVWRTFRTGEQIQDNLFRRVADEKVDLIAYYPFDETGSTSRAADESFQGNHLTVSENHFDPPGTPNGIDTVTVTFQVSTAPVGEDAPQVRDAIGNNATSFNDAIDSSPAVAEYAEMEMDFEGNASGVLKRCYGFIRNNQWVLITGFRVGDMLTEWVGQAQFAPQLIGYIEGAPPVPSENFTKDRGAATDYAGASSVTFTQTEELQLTYTSEKDSGFDMSVEASAKIGFKSDESAGIGLVSKIEDAKVLAGIQTNLDFSRSWMHDSSTSTDRTATSAASFTLGGRFEATPANPEIGVRFQPDNLGLALVRSETADVFALRLKSNNALVCFQMRPNPDIPKDFNIITFQMNQQYVKQGTLDGKIGFRPDPKYPNALEFTGDSSYFKPVEAYTLLNRIKREQEELKTLYEAYDPGSKVLGAGTDSTGQKAADIAAAPLKAEKRNLVNEYVWTASGGLFSQTEEVQDVRDETIGAAYSFQQMAGLTLEGEFSLFGAAVAFELSAMFGGHLNLTLKKQQTATDGFSLEVDVSKVQGNISKFDAQGNELNEKQAGKVDAYRFLTFYLEPDNANFSTFFNRVVDPIWLEQSGEPDAVALRQANQPGTQPACWRVMHRVTYVSRVVTGAQDVPAASLDKSLEDVDIESNFELIKLLEPFVHGKTTFTAFADAVTAAVTKFLPALAPHLPEIIRTMSFHFGVLDDSAQTEELAVPPSSAVVSAAPDKPLTVTAGLPVFAASGATIPLTATAAGATTFAWTQTAGPEPAIFLSGANVAAPQVQFVKDGLYRFRVNANDGRRSGTAETAVTVGRVSDGLVALYAFHEGQGTTVRDISGVAPAMDLIATDAAAIEWLNAPPGLHMSKPGMLAAAVSPKLSSIRSAGELTVEAWLDSVPLTGAGMARIATVSGDLSARNFTLGASDGLFHFGVRTGATNPNVTNRALAGGTPNGLCHVVCTRSRAGEVRIVLNGTEAAARELGGDFSTWDASFRLGLGGEFGDGGLAGGRAFLGTYRLVALYNRALTDDEIARNFAMTPTLNMAPVARAGADQVVDISFNPTISLVGTAVDDGTGVLTGTWTQLSGPKTATLNTDPAVALAATATFDTAGVYRFRLSVSDGRLTSSDSLEVLVNRPPLAKITAAAGTAQNPVLLDGPAATLALTGEIVADGLGDRKRGRMTTLWQVIDRPSEASIANPPALRTAVTFTSSGTFTLRLTVNNGFVSGASVLQVTVASAPVLDAGANQTVVAHAAAGLGAAAGAGGGQGAPGPVSVARAALAGTVTNSGIGNPAAAIRTTWTASGPGSATFADAHALETVVDFSRPGKYVLQLEGNNGFFSSRKTVTIVANAPPLVDAGADQNIVLPARALLEATVADDGLPDPPGAVTLLWSKVSGPGNVVFADSSSDVTSAQFSQRGVYVVQLTGSDGTATGVSHVTVSAHIPPQFGPSSEAGLPRTDVPAALHANVTDFGLADAAVTTAKVNWSAAANDADVVFSDATSMDPAVTFLAPGTFTLNVDVNNGFASTRESITLTVLSIQAGANQTLTLSGGLATAVLNGSVVDRSSGTVGVAWTKASGPNGATIASADQLQASATITQAGTYVFRLTVTKGFRSNHADVTVVVE